jgi:anti-sigma regulatory factor (Ser/Thr protein kinase)
MMTASTANSVEDPFVHPALLYKGDAEYLNGTVPFITEGLAAGDPVAAAVPTRQLRLLRTALGTSAADVRLLDMTEVGRNPGRILAGVLFAFVGAHPGRRVRIVGEPVWPLRSAEEYPACVANEALINHAFTGRQVTILCPYDVAGLSAAAIADAAMTHPTLIDGDGTRHSDSYSPDKAISAANMPLAHPPDAQQCVVDTADMTDLRGTVGSYAAAHGLTGERAQDLVLAVTELASNSLEHAHSSATVLLSNGGTRVICQVRDTGHITDPLAGRRPVPPDQPRGRGLLLVNQLSDLVRVHTGPDGTTVEIQFAVR